MKNKNITMVLLVVFINGHNCPLINSQSMCIDTNSTIIRYIALDYKSIGKPGTDFFENDIKSDSLMILVDFDLIIQLSKIALNQYKLDSIKHDKYVVKKYISLQNQYPYCLIEIITQELTKNKKIPVKRTNILIMSERYPTTVELEFDENGLAFYKIENRSIVVVRENIKHIDDEINNSVFYKSRRLIEKYKKKHIQ